MSLPVSFSSFIHDRVGRVVIGPPIAQMKHAYLIPGDRVALDPPQPDNVDWLHEKLTVLDISYGSLHRLGPLLVLCVVACVVAGMCAMGLISGVKTGAHKVENIFSSSPSPTSSLTPDQQAQKARCQSIAAQGGYIAPVCQTLIKEQ
ncbi:MAG: hypothetical protein RSP_04950 [Rhodanobacter sp.]